MFGIKCLKWETIQWKWDKRNKKFGYLVKQIPKKNPLICSFYHVTSYSSVNCGIWQRQKMNLQLEIYICMCCCCCCCWLPAAGGGSGCRRSGKNSKKERKKKLTLFNINCLWNYIKCIFVVVASSYLLCCCCFLLRSSASLVHLCMVFSNRLCVCVCVCGKFIISFLLLMEANNINCAGLLLLVVVIVVCSFLHHHTPCSIGWHIYIYFIMYVCVV